MSSGGLATAVRPQVTVAEFGRDLVVEGCPGTGMSIDLKLLTLNVIR